MNLFTYGTLMFPAIWRRIVGRDFVSQTATVTGFAVSLAADGVYPVMVEASPSDRVAGVIYRDVTADALQSLDQYESDLYDRVEIQAVLADSELLQCEAYVLPRRNHEHASHNPWSADEFERDHLQAYLQRLG